MGPASSPCLGEDEVLAFVAGELASQRRREVLVHVDGCESCRLLAAEIARDQSGDPSPDDVQAPTSAGKREVGELVSQRFRLGEVLGRGAMGTVFRAHDEQLGTDVALKLLRRGAAGSTGFEKELRVGRRITHANVCRLYDAGSTDHYDYITMELIDGETLAGIVTREVLSRARVVEILREVAAGLAAAHAQGVVHRDLKPSNVMIERSGRAVLTDFGLAADLEGKQSRRLVGTPAYWAPEQARGEPPTPASDVYSYGVLAYRMLTGHDLTLSDADALNAVPRDLRRFVAKCTAHRPSERYRDAAEVGRALDDAGRAGSPRRRMAALLVACAVGAAGWALAHQPSSPIARTPSLDSAPIKVTAPAASAAVTGAVGAVESSAPPVIALAPPPPGTISAVASATSASVAHPSIKRPFGRPASSASPPVAAPADSSLLYRR